MDSTKRREVSGPLKHLLSLDWDCEVKADPINEHSKILKPGKKVRFADQLENVDYLTVDRSDNLSCETVESGNECCKVSLKHELHMEGIGLIASQKEIFKEYGKALVSNTCQTDPVFILSSAPKDYEMQPVENASKLIANEKSVDAYFPADCKFLNSGVNKAIDVSDIINQTKDLKPKGKPRDAVHLSYVTDLKNSSELSITDVDLENLQLNESKNNQPESSKSISRKSAIKQSSKINSLLKKHNFTDHQCAVELQSVMFYIWHLVKKYDEKIKTNRDKDSLEEMNVDEKKTNFVSTIGARKKPRRENRKGKAKRTGVKDSNSIKLSIPSSDDKDDHECQLAYKAWKLKKDAVMRQNYFKDCDLERDKRVNILINEGIRGKASALAYISWKLHKYQLLKKEMELRNWLQLQGTVKTTVKAKRNEEALTGFEKWLEEKNNPNNFPSSQLKNKPPWYPPGKN